MKKRIFFLLIIVLPLFLVAQNDSYVLLRQDVRLVNPPYMLWKGEIFALRGHDSIIYGKDLITLPVHTALMRVKPKMDYAQNRNKIVRIKEEGYEIDLSEVAQDALLTAQNAEWYKLEKGKKYFFTKDKIGNSFRLSIHASPAIVCYFKPNMNVSPKPQVPNVEKDNQFFSFFPILCCIVLITALLAIGYVWIIQKKIAKEKIADSAEEVLVLHESITETREAETNELVLMNRLRHQTEDLRHEAGYLKQQTQRLEAELHKKMKEIEGYQWYIVTLEKKLSIPLLLPQDRNWDTEMIQKNSYCKILVQILPSLRRINGKQSQVQCPVFRP